METWESKRKKRQTRRRAVHSWEINFFDFSFAMCIWWLFPIPCCVVVFHPYRESERWNGDKDTFLLISLDSFSFRLVSSWRLSPSLSLSILSLGFAVYSLFFYYLLSWNKALMFCEWRHTANKREMEEEIFPQFHFIRCFVIVVVFVETDDVIQFVFMSISISFRASCVSCCLFSFHLLSPFFSRFTRYSINFWTVRLLVFHRESKSTTNRKFYISCFLYFPILLLSFLDISE